MRARWRLRMGRALVSAGVVAGALAAPALALDPEPAVTDHARAIGATWLADAPPPPAPVAVCVIDTGVSITPDTDGPVVARLSLRADGDGSDPFRAPDGHGTTVASLIAAPRNGWGTVGVWPGAQIISVRADSTQGGPGSPPIWSEYDLGIRLCLRSPQVKVINLSLAAQGYQVHLPGLLDAIADARAQGVSVVAAAGNARAGIEYPGSFPGVIPVAATTADGSALCGFSARAIGVVAAPGCDILAPNQIGQLRLWDGTSLSAPMVAAVLAALRAYRPDLSAADAEGLVSATAQPGPEGVRRLDAAAAFRAAGLTQFVRDPPPLPAPPPPPPPEIVYVPVARPPLPPRPRVIGRVRTGRDELLLRLGPIPRGMHVSAFPSGRVDYLGPRTIAVELGGRRRVLALNTIRRWAYNGEYLFSRPLRIRVPAAGPVRRGRVR